jgi:isocitrate/isopropylmalate dehydrogenase
MVKIAVAKGDGIGSEIMDAVLHIFDAAKVPLQYEFVDMGNKIFDKGFSNGMTPAAKQTIEELGILFKGPMETPKGKGIKSINVTARKTWNTYANIRTFQTLHGVDTVFSKAGIPVDITIVRENIEDTYGAHQIKLPAGHMVLYPATSLHKVNPVTRGVRIAAFFWMQSLVREDSQRALLFELDTAIQKLHGDVPDHAALVQLTGVYHNLLRRWADT